VVLCPAYLPDVFCAKTSVHFSYMKEKWIDVEDISYIRLGCMAKWKWKLCLNWTSLFTCREVSRRLVLMHRSGMPFYIAVMASIIYMGGGGVYLHKYSFLVRFARETWSFIFLYTKSDLKVLCFEYGCRQIKVLCFEYGCRQTVIFAKGSLQAFLYLKSIPLLQNIG